VDGDCWGGRPPRPPVSSFGPRISERAPWPKACCGSLDARRIGHRAEVRGAPSSAARGGRLPSRELGAEARGPGNGRERAAGAPLGRAARRARGRCQGRRERLVRGPPPHVRRRPRGAREVPRGTPARLAMVRRTVRARARPGPRAAGRDLRRTRLPGHRSERLVGGRRVRARRGDRALLRLPPRVDRARRRLRRAHRLDVRRAGLRARSPRPPSGKAPRLRRAREPPPTPAVGAERPHRGPPRAGRRHGDRRRLPAPGSDAPGGYGAGRGPPSVHPYGDAQHGRPLPSLSRARDPRPRGARQGAEQPVGDGVLQQAPARVPLRSTHAPRRPAPRAAATVPDRPVDEGPSPGPRAVPRAPREPARARRPRATPVRDQERRLVQRPARARWALDDRSGVDASDPPDSERRGLGGAGDGARRLGADTGGGRRARGPGPSNDGRLRRPRAPTS
jgi:hypothetical protein